MAEVLAGDRYKIVSVTRVGMRYELIFHDPARDEYTVATVMTGLAEPTGLAYGD